VEAKGKLLLYILIPIGLFCKQVKENYSDNIAELEIARLSRFERILKNKSLSFNELLVAFPEGKTTKEDLKENITVNRYTFQGAADILLTAISHRDKIIEAQFTAGLNCSDFLDPDRCTQKIKDFYKTTKFSYWKFGRSFYYEYYSDTKSRYEGNSVKNSNRLSQIDKRIEPLLHLKKSAGGPRIGYQCGSDGEYVEDRLLIKELYQKKDFFSLLKILYGNSIYGRMYAAEALMYAYRAGYTLEERDKIMIKILKESDYLMHLCSGCLIYTVRTQDHFMKIEERLNENTDLVLKEFVSYY